MQTAFITQKNDVVIQFILFKSQYTYLHCNLTVESVDCKKSVCVDENKREVSLVGSLVVDADDED